MICTNLMHGACCEARQQFSRERRIVRRFGGEIHRLGFGVKFIAGDDFHRLVAIPDVSEGLQLVRTRRGREGTQSSDSAAQTDALHEAQDVCSIFKHGSPSFSSASATGSLNKKASIRQAASLRNAIDAIMAQNMSKAL